MVVFCVRRELEREDQANDWETAAATAATKDMSLKEGEKIKINIGGMVSGPGLCQFGGLKVW